MLGQADQAHAARSEKSPTTSMSTPLPVMSTMWGEDGELNCSGCCSKIGGYFTALNLSSLRVGMKPRLIQILQALSLRPMTIQEIADRLGGLSPVTVRRHLQRLRKQGYWIEIDQTGRYFIMGRNNEKAAPSAMSSLGERAESLEAELEKAVYSYILEGRISGIVAKKDNDAGWVYRFTPEDVATHLGIRRDVAERVLLRLEERRWLRRDHSPSGFYYFPEQDAAYDPLIEGYLDYDEKGFSKLVSKKRLTWPKGTALKPGSWKFEEMGDGRTEVEMYSQTTLDVLRHLGEGFMIDVVDHLGMPHPAHNLPVPDWENEIQPEAGMLLRVILDGDVFPWFWLIDPREGSEEDYYQARKVFWSRATNYILLWLEPLYSSLIDLGLEECVKRFQEKEEEFRERNKELEQPRRLLEAITPQRYWEIARAWCLEILRSCLVVCGSLGISDEGTRKATLVVKNLEAIPNIL